MLAHSLVLLPLGELMFSLMVRKRSAVLGQGSYKYKKGLLVLLYLGLLSYPSWNFAQGVAINNIVATDIEASEDDIIDLDFGDNLPNIPFVLAWIDSSGKQYALPFKTSREPLSIPIGSQSEWKGKIGLVGLSVNNVSATIRKAGFRDIWQSFTQIYPLSPGSINFSPSYFLLGKPFRWICLGIMALSFLLVYALKRRWDVALLIAFLVAWLSYDLRSGYNRWEIISEISKSEWQIPALAELQSFLPKAREVIGPDGSWSKEPLSGFLNSYCKYELADLQYYPPRTPEREQVEYIITTKPRKRNVILQEGPYYLVKVR